MNIRVKMVSMMRFIGFSLIVIGVYSQRLTYEVDTFWLPRRLFEREYPVLYAKACFDVYGRRVSCVYVPREYYRLEKNRLYIYRALNTPRMGIKDKGVWGTYQIKCWDLSDTSVVFDTLIHTYKYLPFPKLKPYFVGDSVVILTGHDFVIYNYRTGYFRSFLGEALGVGGSWWINEVPYHYAPYNQPFKRDGRFYLVFLPTEKKNYARHIEVWHEHFKPLVLCELKNTQLVYQDTLGEFPRVPRRKLKYKVKHIDPWLYPVIGVDTFANEEIYMSFVVEDEISVYDSTGVLLRRLPKYSGDSLWLPVTFCVTKDYLVVQYNKYGLRRGYYLKLLDKRSGEVLYKIRADERIRSLYEKGLSLGFGKDCMEKFFIDKESVYYGDEERVKVYRVRFYVE